MADPRYDVVVVGSGIAGSITALCLQQAGLRTLVVESGRHPRFAIGESTVPSTTLGLDYLARTYRIPELHQIGHYLGLRRIGAAGFPKQTFWFGQHRDGEPLSPADEAMLESLQLPLGPDVHMLRADVDEFLASRLPAYGAEHLEQTRIVEHQVDDDGATLVLETGGARHTVRASLVVDASGHASFFAERLGLRDPVPRLRTHTRTVFGHFAEVPELDRVVGGPNPGFRFHRHSGTQHHCFRGGWIWVIPFDQGVTSVGAVLDPRVHPVDAAISPADELQRLFARFPTVAAHLAGLRPIRPIIRTGRVQFTSRTLLANRLILAPHAAGFVDALYSTGLGLTVGFVARFVPLARAALASPLDMEAFRPIERAFFQELDTVDRIVSGSIAAMGDPAVFKQYWRAWIHSTMLGYAAGVLCDQAEADGPALIFGSGLASWRAVVEEMQATILEDPGPGLTGALERIMDRVDPPQGHVDFSSETAGPCSVAIVDPVHLLGWLVARIRSEPELRRHARYRRGVGWLLRLGWRKAALWARSATGDRQLRRDVDTIRALSWQEASE